MPTPVAVPGAYRAHQHNRQRALEAVQKENSALTRFLFEAFVTDEKSQKTSRELLSLLEKQDRNLESQLAQVQQYVLDRRSRLEEAKLAFDRHLEIHGRANDGHQETLTSINRLASLEDKKHVSLVSRGEAEHSSSSVKEKINFTRRERLLFEGMWKKYRKELGKIGSEVLCMVTECTERIDHTKKSKACALRLQEVARQEEEEWASSWRAQILRMESFTDQEGRSQRARAEEKRARALALLGGRGVGGRAEGKVKVGEKRQDCSTNFSGNAIERVKAHVLGTDWVGTGGELPAHLAIVRAFEEVRNAGMAKALCGINDSKRATEDHGDANIDGTDAAEVTEVAEVGSQTMADTSGGALGTYRSLIVRLCEAVGLTSAITSAITPDVVGEEALLTLLAMIELHVLVSCNCKRRPMDDAAQKNGLPLEMDANCSMADQ